MSKKSKPTDKKFTKSRFYDIEAEEEESEDQNDKKGGASVEENNETFKFYQEQADLQHSQNVQKQKAFLDQLNRLEEESYSEEDLDKYEQGHLPEDHEYQKADAPPLFELFTDTRNTVFMVRCLPGKEYASVIHLGKKALKGKVEAIFNRRPSLSHTQSGSAGVGVPAGASGTDREQEDKAVANLSLDTEKTYFERVAQEAQGGTPASQVGAAQPDPRERPYKTMAQISFEDFLPIYLQIIDSVVINSIYVPTSRTGYFYVEINHRFRLSAFEQLCRGYNNIQLPLSPRLVPTPELPKTFSFQPKPLQLSPGDFCRVASGKYTGDLAQVAALNREGQAYEVRLVPRISLGALKDASQTAKGGSSAHPHASRAPKADTGKAKQGQEEQYANIVSKPREKKNRKKAVSKDSPFLLTEQILSSNGIAYRVTRNTVTGVLYVSVGGHKLRDGFVYARFPALKVESEKNPSSEEMKPFLDYPLPNLGVDSEHKGALVKKEKFEALLSAGLSVGERVVVGEGDFCNLVAVIETIEKGFATLAPVKAAGNGDPGQGRMEGLKGIFKNGASGKDSREGDEVESLRIKVPLNFLKREFRLGDSVVVTEGEHKGRPGLITSLLSEAASKPQDNASITTIHSSGKAGAAGPSSNSSSGLEAKGAEEEAPKKALIHFSDTPVSQAGAESSKGHSPSASIPIVYLRGNLLALSSKLSILTGKQLAAPESLNLAGGDLGPGTFVQIQGKRVGVIVSEREKGQKEVLKEDGTLSTFKGKELSGLSMRQSEKTFDANSMPLYAKSIVRIISGKYIGQLGTILFVHGNNIFLRVYGKDREENANVEDFANSYYGKSGRDLGGMALVALRSDQVNSLQQSTDIQKNTSGSSNRSNRSIGGAAKRRFKKGERVKIIRGAFKTLMATVKSVDDRGLVVEVCSNKKTFKLGFADVKGM